MRWRYWAAILLIFAFLLSCLGPSIPANANQKFQTAVNHQQTSHRQVHFEPTYSPIEQELLRRAFNSWSAASSGYLTWDFVAWPENYWDEDFLGPQSPPCLKHLLVFKQQSTDFIVINIETKVGFGISGYATRSNRECGLDQFFLVTDKLNDPEEFKQIATHEIGHILGMDHDDDGQLEGNPVSVMSYDWMRNLQGPSEYDVGWLLKLNHLE